MTKIARYFSSTTERGFSVGALTRKCLIVTAVATLTACSAFPDAIVGLGGRSTASMNTALSRTDIQLADAALFRTLQAAPNGAGLTWNNNQTGNSGAYRVEQTFQDNNGQVCRRYQELLSVAGAREAYNVNACRDVNAQWRRLEAL